MAEAERQITREGREDLLRELANREKRRDEIIESLREARGFGDLSENAEYDAAREEQASNEARINEINQILATARVIDMSQGDVFSVSIDTTVTLDDGKGNLSVFSIVGTTQTNSLNHRISNESPLGAALIGHVTGDAVSYTTPSGRVREYTIVSIEPSSGASAE